MSATTVATASDGRHSRSRQCQAQATPSMMNGPIAPRITPNRNGQEMIHIAWQRQSRTPSSQSDPNIAAIERTVYTAAAAPNGSRLSGITAMLAKAG